MTLATPKLRSRFKKWIKKNGGFVRPSARNEFVRFIAYDQICIVYEKKGAIAAMVGDETAECWIAFEAGQSMNLASERVAGRGLAEFRGRRAIALAVADIRNGRSEALSVRALSRSTGIAIRTLARIARTNGGRVCGMKLMRSA